MADDFYSTKEISIGLIDYILESIHNVEGWGTVEIFIQDYKVTQVTEKTIKKTKSPARTRQIPA